MKIRAEVNSDVDGGIRVSETHLSVMADDMLYSSTRRVLSEPDSKGHEVECLQALRWQLSRIIDDVRNHKQA